MKLPDKLNVFIQRYKKIRDKFSLSNVDVIILFLIAIGFLGIIGQILTLNFFNTISIILIYFIVAGWFIYDFIIGIKAKKKKQLTFFFKIGCLSCVLLYFILSLIHNKSIFTFTIYKKLIMSSSFLLLLSILFDKNISLRCLKSFSFLSFITSVLIFIIFLAKYRGDTKNLSLTLVNSNSFAIMLTILIVGDFSSITYIKKIYFKLLFVLLTIFMLVLLFFTSSRGIFFSIILSPLLYLFIKITQNKRRYLHLVTNLIVFIPVIVFCVYLTIYYINGSANLIVFGKPIFSRDAVWTFSMHLFLKSPFAGNYYELNNDAGYSQMHNAFLDILTQYGIMAFVLFAVLICLFVRNKLDKKQAVSMELIGALIMLTSGTFEVSYYNAAGIGFVIMIMLWCIKQPSIANYSINYNEINI